MARKQAPKGAPASGIFVHAPSPEVLVETAALSHPGRVRRNNEDHYLIVRRSRAREVLATNLPAGTLPPSEPEAFAYGIADGMGGAAFGELASLLALRTAWDLGGAATKWTLKSSQREFAELRERGRVYFELIDHAIAARARLDPATAGMGTTLTVAYTLANAGLVFHAGDSRAYLFRSGALERLTRDHTVAEDLTALGIPGVESFHHVLTSHLGAGRDEVRVDVRQFAIQDGDVLLLCSDGLTDMAAESAIAEVLAREQGPREACQALVDLALANGGRDNVTVLIGRYGVREAGSS